MRQATEWAAWALAAVVLLPGAAWGEQTASEVLKKQLDRRLWEEVGQCDGAKRYLEALPEGQYAGKAQECLAAEKEEKEETRRRMKEYVEGAYRALERGNVAGARRRLEKLRELDEEAPAVMDLEDAIAEAEEKLGKMREYAETGHEALGRGDLEKARRYVERLKDAKSPLAVELEEAVEEAEQVAEAKRRRQEAEAERKAEAEEAARRRAGGGGASCGRRGVRASEAAAHGVGGIVRTWLVVGVGAMRRRLVPCCRRSRSRRGTLGTRSGTARSARRWWWCRRGAS